MNFNSDIDIDFGDRQQILNLLQHHPAGIIRDGKLIKHNTGVYFTDIPTDPMTGIASLDHDQATDRGYVKLDFLNVGVYNQVRSNEHLDQLLSHEPLWDLLYQREFCAQLTHISNHYDTLIKMPEPVDSIPRLAMLLSIIRPAKRHLIGKTWKEVAESVWERPTDDSYYFKKSHAIAYAHLVVVHMNLICEQVSYGFS
jgi:hypothetical protein